jgi:hypothetical protein
MRIPVRDFYTIIGAFLVVSPFLLTEYGESYQTCTALGLIIGIPLLVVGLNMQSKYSKAIYGDNRVVKWNIWGLLGGFFLIYMLIRYFVD